MNRLFYGDNLDVLRERIPDESVDLVYLDPPFNSNRNYNVLFKQTAGTEAPAQIQAFEDTWTYSRGMWEEFRDEPRNLRLLPLMSALHDILPESEMMAYLLMMAPRLLELHRKLTPKGSFYLHCDPVASHYLKMVLDVVFKPSNFHNEVIWKRADAHNDANQYGRIHDVIFYYSKSKERTWNKVYTPYKQSYIDSEWVQLPSGRFYKAENMLDPQNSMEEYDFMGTTARWRTNRAGMMKYWNEPQTEVPSSHGRIKLGKNGKPIKRCRIKFLDEMDGVPLQSIWDDIKSLRGGGSEARGYPTQKPLALLERIIAASSDPGDVVLDPFCGCGTAVIQAARMGRQWIGIDVTYLAVSEIKYRLGTETDAIDVATLKKGEKPPEGKTLYKVEGAPEDADDAKRFFEQTKPQNHKPFEMWAVSLVEGEPQEKKGADGGIDGKLYFFDLNEKLRQGLIQVKGGGTNPNDVRAFANVVEKGDALLGLFLCFHVTDQMRLAAEGAGWAQTYGNRKIPRVQLLTFHDLLEEKRRFEIPEGFRVPRSKGVGKNAGGQGELML